MLTLVYQRKSLIIMALKIQMQQPMVMQVQVKQENPRLAHLTTWLLSFFMTKECIPFTQTFGLSVAFYLN
jgi:hypothetical protein